MKFKLTSPGRSFEFVVRIVVCGLGVACASFTASTSVAADVVRHLCVDNCPPNFAVCDGQAGVALGLCNGAVASECNGINAGSKTCVALETRFVELTGSVDVPWIYANYPVQSITTGLSYQRFDLETGLLCVDPTGVWHPICPYIADLQSVADLNNASVTSPNPYTLSAQTCLNGDDPRFGQTVEWALLEGVPFADVGPALIETSVFHTASDQIPPLRTADTLIVRTCADNYFKVGQFTCYLADSEWTMCSDTAPPSDSMRVNYRLLRPAQRVVS
jgi:hypothetical protein